MLAQVIPEYVQSVAAHEAVESTLQSYRRYLNQFLKFANANGVFRLNHVTAGLLESFQEALKSDPTPKSPETTRGGRFKRNTARTIRDKLKTVRQLIRWALHRKMLSSDPTVGYRLPSKPKAEAYCWTPEEFRRLRACFEEEWRDVFDFFALTGVRHGEFCWFLRDDVILAPRPYLHVRPKECPQTGMRWRPKHNRERIIPLCPEAVQIARRALEFSPGPWLFWSPNARSRQTGHYLSGPIIRALNRAKKKAGIGKGTVHTFRHWFCSFAANNGVPPTKLMRILGHESLEITLRYYHLAEGELLDTLNGLPFEQLLAKEVEK